MAYIYDVDTHLRDDGEQAHQFAWTIAQAGVDHEVATSRSEAMLDKTPDQVDIDVSPGQWHQHLFAGQCDRSAQECRDSCRARALDQHLAAFH